MSGNCKARLQHNSYSRTVMIHPIAMGQKYRLKEWGDHSLVNTLINLMVAACETASELSDRRILNYILVMVRPAPRRRRG
jgi:hypothetical protein